MTDFKLDIPTPSVVAGNEAELIKTAGFCTRVFTEHLDELSWGYTVGLKDAMGLPVCIFARCGVPGETLNDLLWDAGYAFSSMKAALPVAIFENACGVFNKKTGRKLRMKIKEIQNLSVKEFSLKYKTPIEAQSNDCRLYWAMFSDEGDCLPGEVGYKDWSQLSVNTVERDQEDLVDLIETDEDPED